MLSNEPNIIRKHEIVHKFRIKKEKKLAKDMAGTHQLKFLSGPLAMLEF